MTHKQASIIRAWAALATFASMRVLPTYKQVANLADSGDPQGISWVLDPIYKYCVARHLPPLTIIVVRADEARPSVEYPGPELPRQLARVFEFDWSSHKVDLESLVGTS
jgi:hypothetical protein